MVKQDKIHQQITCLLRIPEIISKISKVMTLEKGDIISTGTPAGVAC